jgi:hypothetical protein
MLTFFEIQTLEDWEVPAIVSMHAADEIDESITKKTNKSYVMIIFVTFIFLTTFFILNMFITILITSF